MFILQAPTIPLVSVFQQSIHKAFIQQTMSELGDLVTTVSLGKWLLVKKKKCANWISIKMKFIRHHSGLILTILSLHTCSIVHIQSSNTMSIFITLTCIQKEFRKIVTLQRHYIFLAFIYTNMTENPQQIVCYLVNNE